MLCEDMCDEGICNINGSDIVGCRNKYTFLQKAIDDHQNHSEPI